MGLGLTGKPGSAWVGAWVGAWVVVSDDVVGKEGFKLCRALFFGQF